MHPLNTAQDLTPLINDIEDRPVVMLGEASHGTHEYYTWRTAISKLLIQEKGFNFIAVEGDWPDCYKITRSVKGYKDAGNNIREVLGAFDRWPTGKWLHWRNGYGNTTSTCPLIRKWVFMAWMSIAFGIACAKWCFTLKKKTRKRLRL